MTFLMLFPWMVNGQDEKNNSDAIGMAIEVLPRFPGCEDEAITIDKKEACAKKKMLSYIHNNLIYPDNAKADHVKEVVIVQFVVKENGDIEDARVVKSIGYGCDEEALRLVESMNDMEEPWVPGRKRGKIVKVLYTLSVRFNPDF